MNEKRKNNPGKESLTKDILLFFVRFTISSLILYILFEHFGLGREYTKLAANIAKPFLALFHYRLIVEKAIMVTEELSLNPVVFISLVIATAGLTIKSRIKAVVIGFAILTALNSFTLFMSFLSYYKRSEILWAQSEFLILTINFFLPILLWFALVPSSLRELFKRDR